MAQISKIMIKPINEEYAIYTVNFIFLFHDEDIIKKMFWKHENRTKDQSFGKKKKTVFHANPELLSKLNGIKLIYITYLISLDVNYKL